MNDAKIADILEPRLQEENSKENSSKPVIGLPANYADTEETRLLLTPEACGLLTSAGWRIVMEIGAGVDISFSDEAYAEYGVELRQRAEVLRCENVITFAPLNEEDIRSMQEGATLLCMMGLELFDLKTVKALLEKRITLGCFDNMYSHNDEPVFANIIDEIDGRCAILYAEDYLSYLGGGKGVLLAGVAGINPCEVLIIGEGMDAFAAASAAIAAGAQVTLLNNDVSVLAAARQLCGEHLVTLAIHPRVLTNKCKTADVLILSSTTRPFEFPNKLNRLMKESAFVIDLQKQHPSVSVPRTVAMAMSNIMVNFLQDMLLKGGFEGMMCLDGVNHGVVTYRGKLCDKLIASYLGMPSVDIKMMLAAKN